MAANADAKKFRVTVFLIKDGYSKIEEFLTVKDLKVLAVKSGSKEIGTLVYKGICPVRPTLSA